MIGSSKLWRGGKGKDDGRYARRRRKEADRDVIPLRLLGVGRGTVVAATVTACLFGLFTVVPLVWILINATKTQGALFNSFGFWFGKSFVLIGNFKELFRNVGGDGYYFHWYLNTVLYSVVAGIGGTVLATLAGYGFARFKFRGSKVCFYVIVSALLVPITAITFPLFFTEAKTGMVDTVWGMIAPSAVSPVAVYLMRVFASNSVPLELMDAARIDGAGELRIFGRIAMPLMVPGMATVLVLNTVSVWNSYLLPLVVFSKANLYPLTVGLGTWAENGGSSANRLTVSPILIGSILAIVPLLIVFIVVQKYWRGGALSGAMAGN